MQRNTYFKNYVVFVLITIFLVIIAGSVVRTTQSGMGCPDWPKCFGQYIPPTEMEQVLFQPKKDYSKGQFIRYNDSLWSAVQKFKSNQVFEYKNWQHYNKHGYTKIVIYQTWIEYINRLLGALLGIFVLVQAFWSFKYLRSKPAVLVLSILLVLLTGFQAWLGKTVVDSNLAEVKISIHLAGAIALCFLQIFILQILNPLRLHFIKKNKILLTILFAASVVQFFMGVLVRQKIDVIAEKFNFTSRATWLGEVGTIYYVHRSFSILLIVLAIYVWKVALPSFRKKFIPILCILFAQLCVGILFNYFSFPQVAQPIHLTLASIQLTLLLRLLLAKRSY